MTAQTGTARHDRGRPRHVVESDVLTDLDNRLDVVDLTAGQTQSLDVWTVQRLHRAVQDAGASKGILITTAGIDSASHAYASGKPLELIDGTGILGLIAQHTGIRVRLPQKDRRATSRD